MDRRLIRGISVLAAAVGATILVRVIFVLIGSGDSNLVITFATLASALFAIEIHGLLDRRFGRRLDPERR